MALTLPQENAKKKKKKKKWNWKLKCRKLTSNFRTTLWEVTSLAGSLCKTAQAVLPAIYQLCCKSGFYNKEMIATSKQIWEFAMSKEIILISEYLPHRLNIKTDWASANIQDSTQWLLSPRVFTVIYRVGSFCIESMPSDTILHVVESRSTQPSNRCIRTELETSWATACFSPFANDRKVILKVKAEVDVILITPSWPAQPGTVSFWDYLQPNLCFYLS